MFLVALVQIKKYVLLVTVKYAESSSDSSDDESLAELKRRSKKAPKEQKSPAKNKRTKTKLKDKPPKG